MTVLIRTFFMGGYMKTNILMRNRKVRSSVKYFYLATVALFSITTLATDINVKEHEVYTDRDHVAMYIYEFDELPNNYIPKNQSFTVEGENLYLYNDYRNDGNKLPIGELYTEAYINATKTDVGEERLVYTIGTVYYTDNHYETFELLTTEDILNTYRSFLITTSIFTISGPAAVMLLIKKDDELTYSILVKDTQEDFKYIKKKFLKHYSKIKDKIIEITD